MDIRIEDSAVDHVLAVWDRVVIAVFRGKTSFAAVKRCEQIFDQYQRQLATPLLLLTVVDVEAPLPALDVRMELVASLHRANGRMLRSAVVFEGDGFKAASVRAVVAGISLFARPAYPHRVFSRVGSAARFLAGGPDGTPAPHLLIRAVNQARARQGIIASVPAWLPASGRADSALRPR
jgi:hypothetical protein